MIMITMRFFIIGVALTLFGRVAVCTENAVDPVLLSSGNLTVTSQDLQQTLLALNEAEKAQILVGLDPLKNLLRQIYQEKQIAAEAERLGLEQTPRVQAQLAIQRRLVLSKALRDHLQEQIGTPDFTTLARQYYAAHRDEFTLPVRFKAAHILKKVHCDCERGPQRQKIEQLLVQLQAGADFAALAKAESEDPGSAAKGGDLGSELKLDQLVPPFADALAKLQVDQLSDVVETQFGFHIIKKLDEQPARQQSFEEVQKSIEQHLRQTYVQDQLRQRYNTYQAGADTKFNESALESLLTEH